MRARVLGSGAGGGFPQWNCALRELRERAPRHGAAPRTQASLAVSADGEALAPPRRLARCARADRGHAGAVAATDARSSPIAAIALPNGDLDAWLGLLSLREWTPLWCTPPRAVRRDPRRATWCCARWSASRDSRWPELAGAGARLPLAERALHRGGAGAGQAAAAPGRPSRAAIRSTTSAWWCAMERAAVTLAWFPSVARPTPARRAGAARGATLMFFDGTFCVDDELRARAEAPGAREMGHWPVGGAEGARPVWRALPARHKWLVHVNNTNPLLARRRPERAAPARGSEIELARRLDVTLAHVAALSPAIPSSSACATRARAAITITTRFIWRCTRARSRARSCRPGCANRYYYQTRIPIKDALILSKSEDPAFRRMWMHRIIDHDGAATAKAASRCGCGWRRAVGLDASEVASCRGVLPGVRFACDAYVELVRERTLLEAVASSLTEFFAPDLMQARHRRLGAALPVGGATRRWRTSARACRARGRDAEEALALRGRARAHAASCRSAAWRRWCARREILWHLLDCVAAAYARRRSRARCSAETRRARAAARGCACARPGARPLDAARARARLRPERHRARRSCAAVRRRAHASPRSRLLGAPGGRRATDRAEVCAFVDELAARGLVEASQMSRPRPTRSIAELTYRCPLRCALLLEPGRHARRARSSTDRDWMRASSPRRRRSA